jgi:hypothetical protein
MHFASDEELACTYDKKTACTLRATRSKHALVVRRELVVICEEKKTCTCDGAQLERREAFFRATRSKRALLVRLEASVHFSSEESKCSFAGRRNRALTTVHFSSDEEQSCACGATTSKRAPLVALERRETSAATRDRHRCGPGPDPLSGDGGRPPTTMLLQPPSSIEEHAHLLHEWHRCRGGGGVGRCPYRNHDRARPWPAPALAIVASRQRGGRGREVGGHEVDRWEGRDEGTEEGVDGRTEDGREGQRTDGRTETRRELTRLHACPSSLAPAQISLTQQRAPTPGAHCVCVCVRERERERERGREREREREREAPTTVLLQHVGLWIRPARNERKGARALTVWANSACSTLWAGLANRLHKGASGLLHAFTRTGIQTPHAARPDRPHRTAPRPPPRPSSALGPAPQPNTITPAPAPAPTPTPSRQVPPPAPRATVHPARQARPDAAWSDGGAGQ